MAPSLPAPRDRPTSVETRVHRDRSMISIVPPELTERILSLCHPRDVASFSQTCRRAHTLVYRSPDQYLWRTLFLDYPFDDPRLSHGPSEVEWCTKLRRRVHAERIARRDGDRHELVDVLLECFREAAPWPHESSHNLSWVTAVLTDEESPWVERCLRLGLSDSSSMEYFTSGAEKLRAHLALSLDRGAHTESSEEFMVLHQTRRARVYDFQNYYSPFNNCGVNWGLINAIVTVITVNLRDSGIDWPEVFRPQLTVQGMDACRAYTAPGILQRSPLDWAGVEGQWLRIFSFCRQYRTSGRGPGFFNNEVTLLQHLELRIITVESDPRVLERLPDPSRLPIMFGGTIRDFGSEEARSCTVRGAVRVVRDGNIQWSFLQVGDELMSERGVQIGGVCSAAGIVGHWCGAVYSQHKVDPIGPFWLFKVEDDFSERDSRESTTTA